MKSDTTASMGTPFPERRIPVCPVPRNLTFHFLLFNSSHISHAVVILPVSQSEPTTKSTGNFLSFHEPFGKCGGFGGLRRSIKETLFFFALSTK